MSAGNAFESLIPSSDPLARLAELAVGVSGRSLDGDQLAVLVFLETQGSPALARLILERKLFQTDRSWILDLVQRFSASQHAREMMELQAQLRNRGE